MMTHELDSRTVYSTLFQDWPDPGRVAIVHDALPFRGGAERVLEAVLELFPHAPVYTLLYNRKFFQSSLVSKHQVFTSFIDSLPLARKHHRIFLPLYPLAVEQFDFSQYDLVISLSYAVAHGAMTRPDQLHIAYLHTPLRYAWQPAYLFDRKNKAGYLYTSWLARLVLHYLRIWDRSASERVDSYLAVSKYTSSKIWQYYRRKAQVIYPPVEIQRFIPNTARDNYYLAVSRLTGFKKVSVVVEAFSRLNLPLIIVGDGAEYSRLAKMAAPNIQFLKWVPDQKLEELYARAKGLVHAAEEDFGIAMVEAQAAGCPVIAFGKGGAAETVIPGRTGILFPEQSADSLVQAVEHYEASYQNFDPMDLCHNAARFSKEAFQTNFLSQIDSTRHSAQLLKDRGELASGDVHVHLG